MNPQTNKKMNLQFTTIFPKSKPAIAGKETRFIEKIWSSLYPVLDEMGIDAEHEFGRYQHNGPHPDGDTIFVRTIEMFTPKIHTIRKDFKERWKPESKIDFWTNFRATDQFRFAPVVPLVSKQKFRIRYSDDVLMGVWIDGKRLSLEEIDRLATNDGFDSTEDFFSWFDANLDGWILHWTPFRYCQNTGK